MRTLTRKLLSLLLVFTMVCAMVPAAMAADERAQKPSGWENGKYSDQTGGHDCTHEGATYTETLPTCKDEGSRVWKCPNDCTNSTYTETLPKSDTHTPGTEYVIEDTMHYQKCSVCGEKIADTGSAHNYTTWVHNADGHVKACVCGKRESETLTAHDWAKATAKSKDSY